MGERVERCVVCDGPVRLVMIDDDRYFGTDWEHVVVPADGHRVVVADRPSPWNPPGDAE